MFPSTDEHVDFIAAARAVPGHQQCDDLIDGGDVDAARGVGPPLWIRAARASFSLQHRLATDPRGPIGKGVVRRGAIPNKERAAETLAVLGVVCPLARRDP